MDPSTLIPTLLGIAVLLPLASFVVILLSARFLKEQAAWIAICAIGGACLLSFISMFLWLGSNWPTENAEAGHSAGHSAANTARLHAHQFFVSTAEEEHAKEASAEGDKGHKSGEAESTATHKAVKRGPYT